MGREDRSGWLKLSSDVSFASPLEAWAQIVSQKAGEVIRDHGARNAAEVDEERPVRPD
jgi:hypothetical protein